MEIKTSFAGYLRPGEEHDVHALNLLSCTMHLREVWHNYDLALHPRPSHDQVAGAGIRGVAKAINNCHPSAGRPAF